MSGGRFGGAGSSSSWGRPGAQRGSWQRPSGARLWRRRPRCQGGHSHFVSSFQVSIAYSNEDQPLRGAFILVNPGMWLDKQWQSDLSADYYEGKLQGTVLRHGQFFLNHWPVNYVSGVQLFIPIAWALVVMPFYDTGGNGNPADFYPSVIPYLFHRNFGRQEAPNNPNDPSPNAPVQRGRIIHRWWTLNEHTDLAYGQAGKVVKHTWTLRKSIPMRHDQALWLCYNAYNTHATDACTVGFQMAYTIGFNHRGWV